LTAAVPHKLAAPWRPPAGGLVQNVIVLDRTSFMGTSVVASPVATDDFKDMSIESPLISNNGIIGCVSGDVTGGGKVHLGNPVPNTPGSLVNNGEITAANGGVLQLFNMDVSGGGSITMTNGGRMEFISVTEFQPIDFGGPAATELSFDPSQNALNGAYSHFDLSDVIDLEVSGTLTRSPRLMTVPI
jgi:hypothetical protein